MREAEARALAESGLGSGLLARQPVPADVETVAVLKVCPQCGTEYETAARFCPSDGTALRPKGTDSLIDRVLADRYHILKRIGEGGMGRVYLGEHVKMNRQCAIKVMSPALVNDAESAARFAREASNAARIIHPNVAAVFDYGESEGLIYLVMEFVDGEPLSRLLAREAPFALDRALDLARQIADGLGAAHELGIVHRDLKPDNILVTRTRTAKEVAKVVDFGIAKAIQEATSEQLTRTGLVIGTPEFMSPEQLLGDPIDARADLYALGCIMFLMLTASPPFEAATREQMIKRRLSEDAPGVQSLEPGIPDSVDRIVKRLLARAPSDRYTSAAEVRDALGGTHVRRSVAKGDAGLDAQLTPRSAPTVAFIRATQATTEVTEVRASTPVRRLPLYIGGAAMVALGVVFALRSVPSPVDEVRQASVASESLTTAVLAAARQDSVARAGTAVVPVPGGAGLIPPVVMLDSATLAARRERQRQRDSVNAEITAARAPIVRYAQALESGDINTLKAAWPSMTSFQQEYWEKYVFAKAEKIDASIRYGETRIAKDNADADITVNLSFVLKDSKHTGASTSKIHQRATLVRQGTKWKIVSISSR